MSRIKADDVVLRVIRKGDVMLQPMPFAGKYPTRISWNIVLRNQKTQRYLGKPNPIAIQTMLKLAANPAMQELSYYEVDKQNVLVSFWSERRNLEDRRGSFTESWNVYHPFTTIQQGWEWISQPWWGRVIAGQRVYSPVEVLKLRGHVDVYTSWLKAMRWKQKEKKPLSLWGTAQTFTIPQGFVFQQE